MKIIIVCICLSVVFLGCKKNENKPTPDPVPNAYEYMPLKTGNYWVYDAYFFNDQTQVKSGEFVDSTVVLKDTTIHGSTFYKIEYQSTQNSRQSCFLRDSLGYLVDENGIKHLSVSNFIDTLYKQTLVDVLICYKMADLNTNITVPLGTYPTINFKGWFTSPADNSVRNIHNIYSKNIGKLKQVNPYMYGPGYIARELRRYHLN